MSSRSRSHLVLLLLAALISAGNCGQRVDIVLSGRDIPSHDIIWGDTEPYVKVYYQFDAGQNYISYGQTTVSEDNPNPDWPQVFSFDYSGGNQQVVKFDMYDEDLWFDDHIGVVELSLGEIVTSAYLTSGMVERNFSPVNRGRLLMKVRIDGVIPAAVKSANSNPQAALEPANAPSAVQPVNPVVALLKNNQ